MPTATQTVSAGTPVLQAQATPPAADADAAPPIEAEATPVTIEGAPREWRAVGVAVVVLAAVAAIALLRWAEAFFVPFIAGILIAYALRPVVALLERFRLPRVLSASAVLVLVVAGLGGGIYALGDDFERAMATLPDAARKIRLVLEQSRRDPRSPIAHVQEAAKELEKAASDQPAPKRPAPAPPARVDELGVGTQMQQFVLKQATSALAVLVEIGLAVLLAFFVLLAGDSFRRKLMHFVGPSLARKRMTIEMLQEIDRHVQRYISVTMVTNIAIGCAVALLAAAVGLDHAVSWGVAAGLLHLVPYVGAAVAAAALAAGGLVQFGTLPSAAVLGAGTLVLAAAIGMIFQTWLQSRASHVNAVALFVGLLFFGWLWGGWGLVLGAPLIAIAKTIADRVAEPLGDLLA
ncbi:MAG: AI-2E family transporter [Burkholderiales bacterium]